MRGLEGGEVKLKIIKCGVSGPPETGKTHVRALMLGLPRPSERVSTEVATEADQLTNRIDALEDLLEGKKEKGSFLVVKTDSMARIIANTLHNEDYSKLPGSSDTAPLRSNTSRSQARRKLKIIKDINKHLKRMKGMPKRKRKGLNNICLVYFVDTGGQPQFQEILPNFIRCDINILVHNLSQPLDFCPPFDYVIGKKTYQVPERMKLTNLSIIEQSVRSITSTILEADVDHKPHVIILGTFKDKCNPVEFDKMLREKSKTINEQIKPYVGYTANKCIVYSGHRGKDQVIVAIDGSEAGWGKNDAVLEKVKHYIVNQAKNRTIEVPIKYFIFLQCLKADAKRRPYVTLRQCEELAPALHMTEQDVIDALKLFHGCNVLLYFPKVLRNIAFIQPGFLFGRVTDLIVSSFMCEKEYMTQDCRDFQNTGIFTSKFLQGIPSLEKLKTDGEFNLDLFLELLKGLFVIAKVGVKKYFMPCVLPLEDLDSEEVITTRELMKQNGIEGPFVLSFFNKMSPRGLFCALLVALVRRHGWQLADLAEGGYRTRNQVEFELLVQQADVKVVTSVAGKVVIIDRSSSLEIYTTCDKDKCSSIRRDVCNALEKACDNLNYSHQHLTFCGFLCNCGSSGPHSTDVDSGTLKERCSFNRQKRPRPLSEEKKVWFKEDHPCSGEFYTTPA